MESILRHCRCAPHLPYLCVVVPIIGTTVCLLLCLYVPLFPVCFLGAGIVLHDENLCEFLQARDLCGHACIALHCFYPLGASLSVAKITDPTSCQTERQCSTTTKFSPQELGTVAPYQAIGAQKQAEYHVQGKATTTGSERW